MILGTARTKPRWWREVIYVLLFYGVYSLIRNQSASSETELTAFANARDVIRVEEWMGLYFEESMQDAFLRAEWFIWFWNVFYGTAHFVVTTAALVWCFRRAPARYRLWRNTLAVTTALALFGYAFYPLMPPRLLPATWGYVDTLAQIGGLWSFDSGAVKSVSNQYAAMPSLHFGWSLWSAFVLWPAARRRWTAALVAAYPVATLFAIVVTANHFWLDAAGGAAVLGAGYLVARLLPQSRPSPEDEDGSEEDGSEDGVSAVDHDRVAGVVRRRAAGEVDGDPGEVVGDSPTTLHRDTR